MHFIHKKSLFIFTVNHLLKRDNKTHDFPSESMYANFLHFPGLL